MSFRLINILGLAMGLVMAAAAQESVPPVSDNSGSLPGTEASGAGAVTVPITSGNPNYILSAGDVVLVRVYQEDDLETAARISKDGTITIPLLGSVNVDGKTLSEANELIRKLLEADYLVNPQVTTTVVEYAKRRFTVLGQVQRPGSYEMPSEEKLDLLQAIAMAGGYTRLASERNITVQRTVNGEKKVFKLDARAIARDRRSEGFEILPDDTITVGESWL